MISTWVATVALFSPIYEDALPDSTWSRYDIGRSGISLELPAKPESAGDLNIGAEVQQYIELMENHQSLSGEFLVMVSFVRYSEGIELDLDNAAEGALAQVRSRPGIEEMSAKKTAFRLHGLPAIYLHGEYSYAGIDLSYHQVLAGEGRELRQIVVTYESGREDYDEQARRVLDSVSIKN